MKPIQMAISWSGSSADRSSGGFKSSALRELAREAKWLALICAIFLGVPGGNPGNQPLGVAGHGGAPAGLSSIPALVYRRAGVNLQAPA